MQDLKVAVLPYLGRKKVSIFHSDYFWFYVNTILTGLCKLAEGSWQKTAIIANCTLLFANLRLTILLLITVPIVLSA